MPEPTRRQLYLLSVAVVAAAVAGGAAAGTTHRDCRPGLLAPRRYRHRPADLRFDSPLSLALFLAFVVSYVFCSIYHDLYIKPYDTYDARGVCPQDAFGVRRDEHLFTPVEQLPDWTPIGIFFVCVVLLQLAWHRVAS